MTDFLCAVKVKTIALCPWISRENEIDKKNYKKNNRQNIRLARIHTYRTNLV